MDKLPVSDSVTALVESLHTDCLSAEPIAKDWSRGLDVESTELGERRYWNTVDCGGCGKPIVTTASSDCSHTDLDSELECDGEVTGSTGPLMKFWYPLHTGHRLDPAAAALKIAGLPVCVVEVDGQYGLALTAGGMNLSWEICQAYVALGQVPPLYFSSQLPSDLVVEPNNLHVLAAARKGAECAVLNASREGAEVAVLNASRAVEQVDRLLAAILRSASHPAI